MVTAKLLPEQVTNEYNGNIIALYSFYAIIGMTIVRSLLHMLLPDGGSESIASIPIDTYSTEAEATVIGIFFLWGLSQLIIGVIYFIVAIRYKSLVPLMWLFFTIEYIFRLLMGFYKPIETNETAPGEVGNFILIPLGLIMLYLSYQTSSNISNSNSK